MGFQVPELAQANSLCHSDGHRRVYGHPRVERLVLVHRHILQAEAVGGRLRHGVVLCLCDRERDARLRLGEGLDQMIVVEEASPGSRLPGLSATRPIRVAVDGDRIWLILPSV